MNISYLKKALIAVLAVLIFTACGNNGGTTPPEQGGNGGKAEGDVSTNPKNNEPVNLTFYRYYAGLSDAEFDQYFVQPIQKKYPNVTLTPIYSGKTGSLDPDNILASGESPDIIYTSNYSLATFKRVQMSTNLTEFIQKNKFNMNQFDPIIIDALKKYDESGEFHAIPFSLSFAPLFYNKSIFDKFGVSYPKEQSTWDDIIELNRSLTRMDSGVQYRGIVPPVVKQFGDQLSLTYADDKTKKATVNNEPWKKVLQLYQQFYETTGMLDGDGKMPKDTTNFFENQTAAMFSNWANDALVKLIDLEEKGRGLDWDMTTYPSFKEAPGIGRRVDFHLLMMSQTSKHKDLVFDIISHIASEEIQMNMTRNARMTSLNNPEMKKHYGEELKIMEGKNLEAALKFTSAVVNPSDFDVPISDRLNSAGYDVALGRKDINTALREAQEAADKLIAEELSK